jgi:hypothetical protein
LSEKQYNAKLSAMVATLNELRARFGDIENEFRAATGYGFDGLTESEARYLALYSQAERVRDRILAAGSQAGRQGVRGDVQGLEAEPLTRKAEEK